MEPAADGMGVVMTFREFHNGLRILLNIDRHELVEAGLIGAHDNNAWGGFRRNPFIWLVRASDEQAAKLWELMERRMPS